MGKVAYQNLDYQEDNEKNSTSISQSEVKLIDRTLLNRFDDWMWYGE